MSWRIYVSFTKYEHLVSNLAFKFSTKKCYNFFKYLTLQITFKKNMCNVL